MILGAVAFVMANLLAISGSRSLLARCPIEEGSSRIVAFLLLRLALISGIVITAGMLHLLTPGGILILFAVVVLGILLGAPPQTPLWPPHATVSIPLCAAGVLVLCRLLV